MHDSENDVQRLNLWDFILLTVFMVILVWAVLWLSPVSLASDPTWTLFGAKLTFFSIIFAIGAWQYRYFYELLERFYRDIVPRWQEWRNVKEATDRLDETVTQSEKAAIITNEVMAARESVNRKRGELKEADSSRTRMVNAVELDRKHYQTALFPLFGIGVSLFVSLVVDLIDRIVKSCRMWVALSHGAFITALLIFFILLIYYAYVLSYQLRRLMLDNHEYRNIRFH